MKIFDRQSIRLKGYDYSQPGSYFVTICTENRQCLFGNIVKGEMVLNSWGRIVEKYCLITEDHFQNIKFDLFIIMPNHFHVIIKIIDTNIPHHNPVGAGSPRPNTNNTGPNTNNTGPNTNNTGPNTNNTNTNNTNTNNTNPNVNNGYPNTNTRNPIVNNKYPIDIIEKSNKNNGHPDVNNPYPITCNVYHNTVKIYQNANNTYQNANNTPNDVVNENRSVSNEIGRGDPATLGQIVGFLKYGVSKYINQIRKTPGIKLWQRNYYEHIIRNDVNSTESENTYKTIRIGGNCKDARLCV